MPPHAFARGLAVLQTVDDNPRAHHDSREAGMAKFLSQEWADDVLGALDSEERETLRSLLSKALEGSRRTDM